jgi:D-psicose/D-tagatose/L-ribulose 3-epimerase
MKHAICNWMFKGLNFEQCCLKVARHGFEGVEIAPFTIFEDPQTVSREKVLEVKRVLADTGVQFVGFHAILFGPLNLHITSSDPALRRRSWDHVRRLIEITAELGGGSLVLGSPQQRKAIGVSPAEAKGYIREQLSVLGPYAAERNAVILVEALPVKDTNVINTMKEAREMIEQINSPGVRGMFDFHNSADENIPWPELIEANSDLIRHIHLNDVNGSYPGTAGSSFEPAFDKLAEKGYGGWISLEIFHQPDDPDGVLSKTKEFLVRMEKRNR